MSAFWIALVILTAVTTALAWMTERAPFDPYAARSYLDDLDRARADVDAWLDYPSYGREDRP